MKRALAIGLAVAACHPTTAFLAPVDWSMAPVVTMKSEKECKKYQGVAAIPRDLVHVRRSLGQPEAQSRSIKSSGWFSTECTVTLSKMIPERASTENCTPKTAEPIKLPGMKLTIREFPASHGRFVMTLLDPKSKATVEVEMHAARYGEDTSSSRYYDALEGTDTKNRKYFVYFEDFSASSKPGEMLPKTYWVQVYYPLDPGSSSYMCPSHMPSHAATTATDKSPRIPSVPRQGGVGGGTEPGTYRP